MILMLPEGLPAGDYHLWVGMYLWQTAERLPVRAETHTVANDRLLLERLHLQP